MEDDIFLIRCLHFPTLAHDSSAVKRVVALQGLISVTADFKVWIIMGKKTRRWFVMGYTAACMLFTDLFSVFVFLMCVWHQISREIMGCYCF